MAGLSGIWLYDKEHKGGRRRGMEVKDNPFHDAPRRANEHGRNRDRYLGVTGSGYYITIFAGRVIRDI